MTKLKKKTLYFLCTGNACRSQIAEGWGKALLSDSWNVYSAGIEAHGLNKEAVRVMKEVGIDVSKQKSELINLDLLNETDLVVTLCGDARDHCPTIPPHIKHEHWGFPDPAKQKGTKEEIDAAFTTVRDAIKERIVLFKQKG